MSQPGIMDLLKSFVLVIVAVSGILSAIASFMLFIRLRWPAPVLGELKLLVSALAPMFVMIGLVNAFAGLYNGSLFMAITGLYTAVVLQFTFCLLHATAEGVNVRSYFV
jgi:hypothetical protein